RVQGDEVWRPGIEQVGPRGLAVDPDIDGQVGAVPTPILGEIQGNIDRLGLHRGGRGANCSQNQQRANSAKYDKINRQRYAPAQTKQRSKRVASLSTAAGLTLKRIGTGSIGRIGRSPVSPVLLLDRHSCTRTFARYMTAAKSAEMAAILPYAGGYEERIT
ncbi:MAG: hypothetical protein JOZ58_20610, partial [Acetobacteraceae bacterium]|nr:hypothetical protein [Acetobacteraceae bacterium]